MRDDVHFRHGNDTGFLFAALALRFSTLTKLRCKERRNRDKNENSSRTKQHLRVTPDPTAPTHPELLGGLLELDDGLLASVPDVVHLALPRNERYARHLRRKESAQRTHTCA
jgi:hypothetical protein